MPPDGSLTTGGPARTDPGARRILEIAQDVLGELDLEVVLRRVLEAARDLTGARYAALGVLDADCRVLERFVTAGIDEGTQHQIGLLPTGRGVLGELITRPEPLRIADVSMHPRSYGFPLGHPPMRSFLGVPVLIGGQPFGNLYLTEKQDADEFSDQDEASVIILAQFAGVAIDHARRFTGSEVRRRELQRTVDALDATLQIAQALGGETDLDAVLRLVAKRGRALVSARALVIEYLRDGELVIAAAAGELPPDLVGQRVDVNDSVASAALRSLRSQRLEEGPNRERFQRYGLGRLGFHATTGLVVPLVFRGRAYGVLVAIDRTNEEDFGADDQRLLEAFASSAATAVATAHSAVLERRSQRLAAAEEERSRWARELHDETLQGMAALRLGLSAALRAAAADDPLAAPVREAVTQLEGEIASLRSLITELRPAALDQLGVTAAVEALAERARRGGLDVSIDLDMAYERGRETSRPVPELETAIYRIIQEALTNASKHGGACSAEVVVVEDDATVRITVSDDGAGFDTDASTEGFGLLGMRERATLLEGTLAVESRPGHGTVLRATLPSHRRRAKAA